MRRRTLASTMLAGLLLSAIVLPAPAGAAAAATVVVDAANDLGTFNNPARYHNQADHSNILGPGDLAKVKALGTIRYTRAWIKPDKYFDETTGSYTYDYRSGGGSSLHQYLDQITSFSQRLVVNIDQCDQSLMTPQAPAACKAVLKNGIRHYKQRYPQVEYVEAFNEPDKNWNPGGDEYPPVPLADYYVWYRAFYQVVNELNAELRPAVPLKLGAPVTYSITLSESYLTGFLDRFRDDPDPAKRLDFIAYHNYSHKADPASVEAQKARVRGWLAARGLASRDIFVTEYGVFPGSQSGPSFEADVLTHAAAMATLGYYYVRSGITMPMHWVFDHPSNNRKSMFVDADDGVPYPYYNLVKMQTMLKQRRIGTTSNALASNGQGVHTLGTRDSSGIAVLATNYQWTTGTTAYDVTMDVTNLPAEFTGRNIKVQRYLVDATTSNVAYCWHTTCAADGAELQKVFETTLTPRTSVRATFPLGLNAMTLYVLTPV